MTDINKNVVEEEVEVGVIDVPVTNTGSEGDKEDPNLLNLEDVAYMIVAGRTLTGETFFKTVGVNDLLVVRGLVEYARDEVKFEFNKHFENTKG